MTDPHTAKSEPEPLASASDSHSSSPSPSPPPAGPSSHRNGHKATAKSGVKRRDAAHKADKNDKDGPVKHACLACRSMKVKCDGVQPVCRRCERKNLECVFVKSRRGGARIRRGAGQLSALQKFLKDLDKLVSVHDPGLAPDSVDLAADTTNVVRTFSSRMDVFDAYYREVHPFLPVMPPSKWMYDILPTLAADSPFLLAAQTILTLIPHPSDPHPASAQSKALRSATSASLARRTMDLLVRTLAQAPTVECVQALAMLSMWEWGNGWDLQANWDRAERAVQVAMALGLHELDKEHSGGLAVEGFDWKADLSRRTWWVVYSAQLYAAIVSGRDPIIGPDDPRIHVDFPICSIQDNAWSNWVSTFRYCARALALVNSVYSVEQMRAWGPPGRPSAEEDEERRRRLVEVDREITEMMKLAEKSSVIGLAPGGEEEVVRNLQLSARSGLALTHIHIHRQQAFPEVSLFSKKLCGLPQAPDFSALAGQSPNLVTVDVQDVPGMPDMGTVSTSTLAPISFSDILASPATSANGSSGNPDAPLGGTTDALGTSNDVMDMDVDVDTIFPSTDAGDESWIHEFLGDIRAPWLTDAGGVASLLLPIEAEPIHFPDVPAVTATIEPIHSPPHPRDLRDLTGAGAHVSTGSTPASTTSTRRRGPRKAWGVDSNDRAVEPSLPATDIFPPGVSLARCATAAHTIVRLEVLHRSAAMAMFKAPPKLLPFCACGLVAGAYAFLLLALAVQAEQALDDHSDDTKSDEVDALLTNVEVILAGLDAYGVMWAGVEAMATEVRAALEAATMLSEE